MHWCVHLCVCGCVGVWVCGCGCVGVGVCVRVCGCGWVCGCMRYLAMSVCFLLYVYVPLIWDVV